VICQSRRFAGRRCRRRFSATMNLNLNLSGLMEEENN
jgi:hypothetical protein